MSISINGLSLFLKFEITVREEERERERKREKERARERERNDECLVVSDDQLNPWPNRVGQFPGGTRPCGLLGGYQTCPPQQFVG